MDMEWINTDTKLPPDGEDVLLIYGFRFASNPNHRFMTKKQPIIGCYFSKQDNWYVKTTVFCNCDALIKINDINRKTHRVVKWMPLPQIPQTE